MDIAPDQRMQPSKAEPSMLMGYGLHPFEQRGIVGAKGLAARRHPAAPQDSARSPVALARTSLEMDHGIFPAA